MHAGSQECACIQVQESWALVAQDLDTHGIKFFMKIFEIAPPALQLFSFRGFALQTNSVGCDSVHAHCSLPAAKIGLGGVRTHIYSVSAFLMGDSDEDDLAKSPKLKAHAANVMSTVGKAVILHITFC